MYGPLGNLREQAKRPGPGSYHISSPLGQGGQRFGQAQRLLSTTAAQSQIHKSEVNKEARFMRRNLIDFGDDDENEPNPLASPGTKVHSDSLDAHLASIGSSSPRAYSPSPRPHGIYLKDLQSTPKLLSQNFFPGASYVNSPRFEYNRHSMQNDISRRPWLLQREQPNRQVNLLRPMAMPDGDAWQ